jgi:hypothetical protein
MPQQPRKLYTKQLPRDKGTPELQQKRKLLLNNPEIQDLALAESLLGVLYAHQMVSKPLYEAGRFFGELGHRYEFCLGYSFRQHTSPVAHSGGDCFGRTDSVSWDALEAKQILDWRKALRALREVGRAPYETVLKVVFYDQDLYTNPLPRSLLKELLPLQKGLERLDRHFHEL